MDEQKDRTYPVDPDATAHELMNEASEWLQYARGLASLLAELMYETEKVKGKDVAASLEAIEALTHIGLQCATQAHTRMLWDQTPPESDLLTRR
jgi:hypothetical protein